MTRENQEQIKAMQGEMLRAVREAVQTFYNNNRGRLRNHQQLAALLDVDGGFISRLLQERNTSLGLKRVLQLAVGLGTDPGVLLLSSRAGENAEELAGVRELWVRYEREERELLMRLLKALTVLKKQPSPDHGRQVSSLLESFVEVSRGKARQAVPNLARALDFAGEWDLFGWLVTAYTYKSKGQFRQARSEACLEKLKHLCRGHPSIKGVLDYFALHKHSALLEDEKGEFESQEHKIAEFREETGEHYTADRLRSKLLRHMGRYEEACAAAEEALSKIEGKSGSKNLLDWLEEAGAHRDLASARTHALRQAIKEGASKRRVRDLIRKARGALKKAWKCTDDMKTNLGISEPEVRSRLKVLEALISEHEYESSGDDEEAERAREALLTAKEAAEQASSSFGIIRASIELYGHQMRRRQYADALRALGDVFAEAQEGHLSPRAKRRLEQINERFLRDADTKDYQLIAQMCAALLGEQA